MARKLNSSKTITLEKEMSVFLKNNPEVEKTLKIFDMNINEYKNALQSMSQGEAIINFKSTQWQPGTK